MIKESSINIDNHEINFSNKAKILGVILDSELSMDEQVKSMKRILVLKLKRISMIRNVLTREACERLVVSIVFS